MKRKSLLKTLKILFFLGIGVFSIWWFLRLLSPEEKKEIFLSFRRVKYGWLVLSMVAGLVSHYLRTLRWIMLIQPLGFKPSVKDTFAAVSGGYIGNFIIPRFGELVRCYIMKKTSAVPVTSSFGTVVAERAIDMLVFMLMFILGLYIFLRQMKNVASGYVADFINGFTTEKIIVLALIIAAGIAGVMLMYFFRRQFSNKPFIGKIYIIFHTFRDGLLSLFKIKQWPLFIIYTILIWACYLMMTWLCFKSLEDTMHLSLVAAFASVTFGTIGIMVVQGGIGVYPAIVAETLLIFGIMTPIGYAMGWITWIAQTVILLIMGLWAVLYLFFHKGIKIDDIRRDQTEDTDTASIV